MERPKLSEEQIQANAEKLDQLREAAGDLYGYDAQFGYFNSEKKFFIMNLDEAIQACGHFIAKVSTEEALETLNKLRDNFNLVQHSPAAGELLRRGEANAQQKLAELAISTD